jgi:hypothetical protein
MGFRRDPKSDTPPFDEHGCEGETACGRAVCVCGAPGSPPACHWDRHRRRAGCMCVRAVCLMHVACSAITVRVRPGSGVQRSAITVRVRPGSGVQRDCHACVRAVCVMYVACSAITVRVRPGSGVQRSAITVRVRPGSGLQRDRHACVCRCCCCCCLSLCK